MGDANFLVQKSFVLVAAQGGQVRMFLEMSSKINVILQRGANAEDLGEGPAPGRPHRVLLPFQALQKYQMGF